MRDGTSTELYFSSRTPEPFDDEETEAKCLQPPDQTSMSQTNEQMTPDATIADLTEKLRVAREAIENAPHVIRCNCRMNSEQQVVDCDCWKSLALRTLDAKPVSQQPKGGDEPCPPFAQPAEATTHSEPRAKVGCNAPVAVQSGDQGQCIRHEYSRHLGWHNRIAENHTWVVGYTGKTRSCFRCWTVERLPQPPVSQPTP